jgi:hypothetical protein
MWLVNCRTLKLEQFVGSNIPKYAILSHTWEKEEVRFQELDSLALHYPTQSPQLRKLIYKTRPKGYHKIYETCLRAIKRNLQYAWIGRYPLSYYSHLQIVLGAMRHESLPI